MDKVKKVTKEWINKAENDYKACVLLMAADDPPLDVVGFHCQQVAEKYLKAILVLNQRHVRKIHDLGEIFQECCEIEPDLEFLEEDIMELNDYGPDVRYPFSLIELDTDTIKGAMERIKTVRDYLNKYFIEKEVIG